MKTLTTLLAFLTTFTLFSCSDEPKDETPAPEVEFIQGTEIPKETVDQGEKSLSTLDEELTVKVNATAGNSYQINIKVNSRQFEMNIEGATPDGIYFHLVTHTIVSPDKFSKSTTFLARESGEYAITISLSEISEGAVGPFHFTYEVTEMLPLTESLEGKWLLTQKRSRVSGVSMEKNYTADSAIELIDIRNDSLITYEYSSYYDYYNSTHRLYLNSDQAEMTYDLRGDSLSYSIGTVDDFATHVYIRYQGDVSDLTWSNDAFVVPDEFIGTWYYTGYDQQWVEYEDDAITYNESDTSLTTSETGWIIKITKDSVTSYGRSWGVDTSTNAIKDESFLQNCRVSSGELVSEDFNFWIGLDNWYVNQWNNYYKPFNGDVPAAWSDITIANTPIVLTPETKYSTTVEKGDTLWFSLSLEPSQSYDFICSNDDVQLSFALFDPNMEKVHAFHSSWPQSYTSSAESHYLGAVVNYVHGDAVSALFDITVSNSNGRASRSPERTSFPVHGRPWLNRR